jgi:hypothetical protein
LVLVLVLVQRGRIGAAGVALAMAVHAKPVALAWLLFASPRLRLFAAIGVVALWLPHLWMRGPLMPPGLLAYAAHWSASPLLYGWLEAPWLSWFEERARSGSYAHLWLDSNGVRLEQAGLTWWSMGQPSMSAPRLLLDHRVIAKVLAAALWIAGTTWLWRRQQPSDVDRLAAGGTGALALWLLLTPTMHPWYALWLLPGLVWLSRAQLVWWMAAAITTIATVRSF